MTGNKFSTNLELKSSKKGRSIKNVFFDLPLCENGFEIKIRKFHSYGPIGNVIPLCSMPFQSGQWFC